MVLSTLHANTSSVGIPRLVDMGIEPFLLASALNAIIAQRLVRRVCNRCIQAQSYSLKELTEMNPAININNIIERLAAVYEKKDNKKIDPEQRIVLYKGKGCNICNNTGYKGRLGIYEVLEMNNQIKTLIMRNATSREIEDAAKNVGMTTMLEDGFYKALNGLTTLEELIRVTKD